MDTPNETYHRLDRLALWVLLFEFGYAGVLIVLLILTLVANLISGNSASDAGTIFVLATILPYGLAFLGNLTIALWGMVLHLRENLQGPVGAGHLLNWIFVSATFWLVLLAGFALLNL